MYVLSRLVVNSMNNITSAKNGGGDAWHERREHHGTSWYRDKVPTKGKSERNG
jgi:hypothetical protein